MKVLVVFRVFTFIFLFRTNVKKNTWIRTTFVIVMVIFSNVPFRKLFDHCYDLTSFSIITSYINHGIWKTPYSWRFYRHRSTHVILLPWVNIIKRKSTKVPGKLSFAQKYEPALRRTLHKDISLVIVCFFFLSNKPSFKIKFSIYWINLAAIYTF